MYYIGVDLGTSAVKLLLMEGSGKICNIVSKEYPLFFPHPGWSEQNPEDWFAQSMEGIKELTEEIDRKEVAGIGFGGQMHGLVTLDKCFCCFYWGRFKLRMHHRQRMEFMEAVVMHSSTRSGGRPQQRRDRTQAGNRAGRAELFRFPALDLV